MMKRMQYWAVAAVGMTAIACGNEDGVVLSPTPGHAHIEIGSTASGGGNLAGDYDFGASVTEALFSACLGGDEDHHCAGGIAVYTGESPAFAFIDADEPEHGLYRLADGTMLGIELVASSAGAAIKVEDEVLDAPGEQAVWEGSTPTLHAHAEWQMTLMDEEPSEAEEREIQFRLFAPGSGYGPSPAYRLRLAATEEGGGHGHE